MFDSKLARFYELLEKNRLWNAHLTDFIKTRAKIGYDWKKSEKLSFYANEFDQHLPILSRELAIIHPTRIVALGEKTYLWTAICKSFLNLRKAKLTLAPHYANRFKKWKEIEREFQECLAT